MITMVDILLVSRDDVVSRTAVIPSPRCGYRLNPRGKSGTQGVESRESARGRGRTNGFPRPGNDSISFGRNH